LNYALHYAYVNARHQSYANALFQSSIVRSHGLSIGSTIDQLDTQVSDIYGMHELAAPSYSDQVLPFDITLAGTNEYGAMCAAKILGVEILNEGSGISVDDAVSQALATFVARAIEPVQTRGSRPFRVFATFRIRYRGFASIRPKYLLFSTLGRCRSGDLQAGVRHRTSPSRLLAKTAPPRPGPSRNCATSVSSSLETAPPEA
jgi:hypothetical protein